MGNTNSNPLPVAHLPPFEKNKEPAFSRESKIVIVGAGPSGLHFGQLLKKNGYKNVVLLETNDRVGGKSHSIFPNGVLQELGTCYLGPQYTHMTQLFKDYGFEKNLVPAGSGFKRKVYLTDEPSNFAEFEHWLFGEVQELLDPHTPLKCCPQVEVIPVLEALERYEKLYRWIFGDCPYGLPPRPDSATIEKINMPLLEFLKKNNLTALIPIMQFGQSLHGSGKTFKYGLIDTVPTFYGLWWLRPEILKSFFHEKFGGPPTIRMTTCGFGTLWETIWKKDELDVRLNTRVKSIDRSLKSPSEPIRIVADAPEGEATFECDFLIYSSGLIHFSETVVDATDEEKEIFSSLRASCVASTLVQTRYDQEGYWQCIWLQALTPDHPKEVYVARLSHKAVTGEEQKKGEPVTFMCGQLMPDYVPGREEELKKIVVDHWEKFSVPKVPREEIKILKQSTCEYFPHFEQEQINKLYPWKIFDMQGKYRTFYIGGSACFESTEDCASYNTLLFEKKL